MNRLIQVSDTIYLKLHYEDITESDGLALSFDINTKWRVNGTLWNTETQESVILTINGIGEIDIEIGSNVRSLSSGDYVEIVGSVYDIHNFFTPARNIYLNQLSNMAVLNPIEINLYQMNCESHLVSKTTGSNLSYINTIYGAFREEQDILTPSIIINYSQVPNFNYVYIPSLSRYYFVMGSILIRYQIYRIDLKVDVLCTYDSDIRGQSGFVTRNENTYREDYIDDRYPVSPFLSYSYIKASLYDTPNYNCKNVSFAQDSNSSGYHWLLTCLNTKSIKYTSLTSPANSDLPSIVSTIPSYCTRYQDSTEFNSHLHTYITDEYATTSIINALLKDDTKATYVYSLLWLPFDIKDVNNASTSTMVCLNNVFVSRDDDGKFVTLNDPTQYGSSVYGYELKTSNLQYCIIADFTYTINDVNKTHREPLCYYELWIPYVGFVKLNSWDIINQRIIVYYAIDIYTGLATAFVKKWSVDTPLFSKPCQIGVKIPIATTNIEELTREKQNNALNLTLGLVGAGVSTAIGIASQNPVAIAGGVLSGTKAIASAVNSNNMLFERAQTNFYSAETSNFSYIKDVYIRLSVHDNLPNFDNSIYGHTQGFPLNNYTSLSSLTGYTEIPELHYIPITYKFITKTEIDEIKSLVKMGVIL